MSILAEVKRRNVFKGSAAYLALGWVVVELTGTIARWSFRPIEPKAGVPQASL